MQTGWQTAINIHPRRTVQILLPATKPSLPLLPTHSLPLLYYYSLPKKIIIKKTVSFTFKFLGWLARSLSIEEICKNPGSSNQAMDDSRVFGDSNIPTTFRSGVGTISRIRLENFMCHDNLQIELDQWVNFVTGRNGSRYIKTLI